MRRTTLDLCKLLAVAGAMTFAPSPCDLHAAEAKAPTAAAAQPLAADDEPAASSAIGTTTAPVVDSQSKIKVRQREGAKLTDRRGRFERRGERYVFLSEEGAAHYVVVENLMLERVANMLDDAAGGELLWSVSGVITEFRGSNFLVLQRAVVKASGGPNEPRRLDDPLAGTPAATKAAR